MKYRFMSFHQKLPNHGGDFSLFMQKIFLDFSKEAIEDWAVIMWSMWNACNRHVFDAIQSDPVVIKNGALSLQRDFRQTKRTLNSPDVSRVVWSPCFICFYFLSFLHLYFVQIVSSSRAVHVPHSDREDD